MLILDLQWLLFAALVLVVVGAAGFGRVDRRLRARRAGGRLLRAPLAAGSALDEAPFGLLLLEGPRTYRYANAAARLLLGLPENGALPEEPWLRVLDADRDAARRQGPAAGRYRTVALAPDPAGPSPMAEPPGRVVRWWVAPVGDGDLVVALDATGERRAEEAMRTLVNDLAHELRTPLATVLTHLEVLGLARLADEARRQSLLLIKAEVGRMVRLLHQLSELGRLEAAAELDRRPLDLLRLAEETVAQMQPQAAARGIALSLEAGTPLPLAEGDEDRLRQVFLNLLDNAVKYGRPGDAVTVSLQPEAGGIRCAVGDTGPGIPPEHLAHVGRRFYRAAPKEAAGSGLGLTLVQEILRRHRSALEIESRVDGPQAGTSARFLLPASGRLEAGR